MTAASPPFFVVLSLPFSPSHSFSHSIFIAAMPRGIPALWSCRFLETAQKGSYARKSRKWHSSGSVDGKGAKTGSSGRRF